VRLDAAGDMFKNYLTAAARIFGSSACKQINLRLSLLGPRALALKIERFISRCQMTDARQVE
jgi:hypothetical protein